MMQQSLADMLYFPSAVSVTGCWRLAVRQAFEKRVGVIAHFVSLAAEIRSGKSTSSGIAL